MAKADEKPKPPTDAKPRRSGTARATAVGAFVLGGAVLAAVAILLFGGANLFTTRLRVVVFFPDSVAGLAVGAPVTLRGVQVGTVRSMRVYVKLPDLVPVIPVYMEIEPGRVSWSKNSPAASAADLDQAIKAGLRAQLQTQSLVTGQVSVNLDFRPETPITMVEADKSVPEIPAIPSDLQHIKDEIADLKLADLADKARIALVDIDQVVGELKGKVGPIAASIQQTSDTARVALETLNEAIHQVQSDASHALASIDRLATTTQGQVMMVGKDADRSLAEIRVLAEHADKAVGSVNELLAARSPLRGDLEATLRDLASSASALRDFSRDLERHPGNLLLGKTSK